MISVDEALRALDKNRPDWGRETLPLGEITGRVLTEDIIAPFSHPRSSVSVMDGYAYSGGDENGRLTIIGESRAGEPYGGAVSKGQAVRIFTGALLPAGTQCVEMQENAILDGNTVSFSSVSAHRSFVRKAGADFEKGARIFQSGDRVTPAMILALATCNMGSAAVQRLPTVALLSSGDELRPVGSALGTGQIVNSISPALNALLRQWGVKTIELGIARDTHEHITEKLRDCKADIIVPIGAASAGDYDLMQPAVKALGFTSIFSKVAVKPGKPTWFSRREDQYVLGLPGNPSSAWVCAQIFLKHLIFGPQPLESAALAKALPANGKRETFLRGQRLSSTRVKALSRQDSGLVTPLGHADILIRRPAHSKEAPAGTRVDFLNIGT